MDEFYCAFLSNPFTLIRRTSPVGSGPVSRENPNRFRLRCATTPQQLQPRQRTRQGRHLCRRRPQQIPKLRQERHIPPLLRALLFRRWRFYKYAAPTALAESQRDSNHSAQGCEVRAGLATRATLGQPSNAIPTLKG